MRILFIGDVMGNPGRRAFSSLLGDLRSSFNAQFVIVNGENVAGGIGITQPTARGLLAAGADAITLGNHAFAKRDAHPLLDEERRIIRLANFPPGAPGRGYGIFDVGGISVAVVNLIGRTYMQPLDCPFRAADAILEEIGDRARIVIVDMHAEATSEKIAMGWYLDGRVSAVLGTHTHVQTADERILPKGTAYISDTGMCGVRDSVLGLDVGVVIQRFLTQVHGRFELAKGQAAIQGVFLDLDQNTGRARSVTRIDVSEREVAASNEKEE